MEVTMKKNRLLPIIIFIIMLILPIFVKNKFAQSIVILVMLYSAAGTGWNILGGYAGQISFGHAVFYSVGAYAPIVMNLKFGMNPWIGLFIGIILNGLLAIIIGTPMFKHKSHYFAIASIALSELFRAIVMNNEWLGGAVGLISPITKEGVVNFQFHTTKIGYYYIILAFLLITLFVVNKLEKSYFGYYLKAIRDSEKAASSLGVNISWNKTLALVFSACITGLAGSFYGQYVMVLDPNVLLNVELGTLIALVSILGGIGNIWGPLLGASIIIPLQELTRAFLSSGGRAVDLIIYSLLIILISIFEPNGILAILSRIFNSFKRKEKAYGNSNSKVSN